MTDSETPDSLRALAAVTGWERQLAALDDDERVEALLRDADTLRAGNETEREIALTAYGLLHRGVDPATPEGCARAAWVLDALRMVDQRFAPLLRAAQENAADRVVRLRSRVAYGAFHVELGNNPEAERLLLSVLRETRGKAEVPERAAVLNLCRLYRSEQRLFEAFVLSRHAVRLFEAAADPLRIVLSLEVVLGCLVAMSEWEEFDTCMRRASALLAQMTHEHVAWWEQDLDVLRFEALRRRGSTAEALAWLDRHEGGAPKWPDHECHDVRWVAARRAEVLCHTPALGEAARLIASVRARPPLTPSSAFRCLQLDAVCAARRGDAEHAREAAVELLSTPLSAIIAASGTGTTLQWFVDLADALQHSGERDLARRALDRAAASAIERIRQTDIAVRAIPELGGASPRDQALLARTRLRFASAHSDLLASLAGLFERAEAAGEPLLEAFRTGEYTRVCAWCARVRIDGEWVPIGHLLPLDGVLDLTHGMCADCGEDLYDQMSAS